MADQDSTNGGNGAPQPGSEPQVSILAQYIKDLSVENPSSPQVFQWQVQPTLDVQFNINVEKVADDVHEVALKIDVSARSENGIHFVVDLSYADRRPFAFTGTIRKVVFDVKPHRKVKDEQAVHTVAHHAHAAHGLSS